MMYEVRINGDIMFPIAPDAIDTDLPNRDDVVDLASGTEFNRRNPVGLKELSFSALLPRFGADLPQMLIDTPGQDIYNELERMKREGTVFSFAVLKPSTINFGPFATFMPYATLGDLKLREDAAELGMHLKVELTIKEHVFTQNEKVDLKPEQTTTQTTATAKQEEPKTIPAKVVTVNQSYTVQKGDTLESIARAAFGDTPNGASLIYQTNKTAIEARAAKDNKPKGYLAVGQVLTIPPYARPASTPAKAASRASGTQAKAATPAKSASAPVSRPSALQPTELRNNTANFVRNAGTPGPHLPVTYVQPNVVMYTPQKPPASSISGKF